MRLGSLSLLLLLVCGGVLAAAAPVPDCTVVSGGSAKGEPYVYVPDNLFDYMNGNAEGYIIYGFQKLTGIECQAAGQAIVLDLFEMASPEMAFGVFASNRHPRFDVIELGMIAQVTPTRAIMSKGKYFLEAALKGGGEAPDVLKSFLAGMEPKLPGSSGLPEALGWFPEEGLEKESLRLVPQSVLGLRLLKRGFIATYNYGRAFIVFEDSPEAAAATMTEIKERLSEPAEASVGEEAYTGKERYLGQLCVARKGKHLFGVAALKDGEDGAARVAAMAARIP